MPQVFIHCKSHTFPQRIESINLESANILTFRKSEPHLAQLSLNIIDKIVSCEIYLKVFLMSYVLRMSNDKYRLFLNLTKYEGVQYIIGLNDMDRVEIIFQADYCI